MDVGSAPKAKRRFDVRLLVRVDGGELELSFDGVPWAVLRDVRDLLEGWSENDLKPPRQPFWRRWGRFPRGKVESDG